MATPRPFGAPTTFTPRFTPQGLLQRSQAEVNSQVARMRNLAGRGFGPFPSDGPIGPGPRPIAPARLPVPGGSGILNTFGRGATALGGLLYGADILKSLLRQAKILPQPSSGVGSIPPTDRRGESYRDAELRLSAAARAAGGPSAGGGIGGGNAASFIPYVGSGASSSPAAERAYRQEVSSVAQQAAQNPELQRYEKESAAAAASKDQGRMDAMRDLGMQIWAQKYGKPGDLASRVKPGQSGYDVIQRTLFPQGSPLPPLSKASQAMLDEIAPANAQGVRENITPMPGQLPAFGGASEAMYQAVTDGGRLVTPMLSPRATTAQETAAQSLVDAYKSSLVGDDEFTQRLKAMQQYMQ